MLVAPCCRPQQPQQSYPPNCKNCCNASDHLHRLLTRLWLQPSHWPCSGGSRGKAAQILASIGHGDSGEMRAAGNWSPRYRAVHGLITRTRPSTVAQQCNLSWASPGQTVRSCSAGSTKIRSRQGTCNLTQAGPRHIERRLQPQQRYFHCMYDTDNTMQLFAPVPRPPYLDTLTSAPTAPSRLPTPPKREANKAHDATCLISNSTPTPLLEVTLVPRTTDRHSSRMPLHLQHPLDVDGRWRLLVQEPQRLDRLAAARPLQRQERKVPAHDRPRHEVDAVGELAPALSLVQVCQRAV